MNFRLATKAPGKCATPPRKHVLLQCEIASAGRAHASRSCPGKAPSSWRDPGPSAQTVGVAPGSALCPLPPVRRLQGLVQSEDAGCLSTKDKEFQGSGSRTLNQVGTLRSAGRCVCPGRAPGRTPLPPSCERSWLVLRGWSSPALREHREAVGILEPLSRGRRGPWVPLAPRGQAQPGSSSHRHEGVRVYILDSPSTSLPVPQRVLSFHLLWLKCVPPFF